MAELTSPVAGAARSSAPERSDPRAYSDIIYVNAAPRVRVYEFDCGADFGAGSVRGSHGARCHHLCFRY